MFILKFKNFVTFINTKKRQIDQRNKYEMEALEHAHKARRAAEEASREKKHAEELNAILSDLQERMKNVRAFFNLNPKF